MVEAVLESSALQPSSKLQQWRQFCFLTTSDLIDVATFLRYVVQAIGVGCEADACLIRYTGKPTAPEEARYGSISETLRCIMTEAESQLAPRQRLPLLDQLPQGCLITTPLRINYRRVGVLQLVVKDASCVVDDLPVLTSMLTNALARYQQAMQPLLAPPVVYRTSQQTEDDAELRAEIAGRKQAEKRLSAVVASAPITLFALDRNGVFMLAEGKGFEALGISPADIVGRSIEEVYPNALEFHQRVRQGLGGMAFTSTDLIEGLVFATQWTPLRDDTGQVTGLVGVATDITERVWAEEARQESEQQFVATFEQAAVGIALIGLGGLWIQVNQRLCSILGYTHEELLTRTYHDIIGSDDLHIGSPVVRAMLHKELHTYTSEKRCVRKDGAEVWIDLTVSLLRTASDAPKYFIAVVEDITERKQAEADNTQLTEALRIERDRLLKREVEVRTQIGRDLHDGPVQQVAVAALMVQYVRRVAQHTPDQLNTAFDELEDQLRRATHDLRTVLYELRPLGIVEEGLVGVLQQYVTRIQSTSGFAIHLDAPAELRRLAPERESAMFIIMQEALNNIRKHAQASDVWLTLSDDATGVYAEVRDNGRGFDVAAMQASYVERGSFGLLNMSERAQLSGGTCLIESQPGQGARIRIHMPFVFE